MRHSSWPQRSSSIVQGSTDQPAVPAFSGNATRFRSHVALRDPGLFYWHQFRDRRDPFYDWLPKSLKFRYIRPRFGPDRGVRRGIPHVGSGRRRFRRHESYTEPL
jgi:hypothetical protein